MGKKSKAWKTIGDQQAREILEAMRRRSDAFTAEMLVGASAAMAIVAVPDKPDDVTVEEAVDCIADHMLECRALADALASIRPKVEEAMAEALKEAGVEGVTVKAVI